MQVLKNGEICPKMNDSELWKDIFPQIKEDDWETVEQYLNKEQDNFVVNYDRITPCYRKRIFILLFYCD